MNTDSNMQLGDVLANTDKGGLLALLAAELKAKKSIPVTTKIEGSVTKLPEVVTKLQVNEGSVTKLPEVVTKLQVNIVTQKKPGRPRVHASAADKQRAYRARKSNSVELIAK